MYKAWLIGFAVMAEGALSGCAPARSAALTEWGTPCGEYGLSPKECHAKFASYKDFLAQPTVKPDPGKPK